MNFKTVSLDSRYRGNQAFKYRLEFFRYNSIHEPEMHCQFQEMCEWLWENYGPGCEQDHYYSLIAQITKSGNAANAKQVGPQWAWHIDPKYKTPYIYIRTDEILSHIKLKWT